MFNIFLKSPIQEMNSIHIENENNRPQKLFIDMKGLTGYQHIDEVLERLAKEIDQKHRSEFERITQQAYNAGFAKGYNQKSKEVKWSQKKKT